MYNEKGMILVEALILLMITSVLVSIMVAAAQVQASMIKQNQRGFDNEIIQNIYQEE